MLCVARSRVAEHGLAAAVSELAPGVTEQALTGVMLEAMAAGGVSTSATQDGAWVTSREHPWRRGPTRRPRRRRATWWPSRPAALADGYVGEVGRTWPVGDVPRVPIELYRRSNELWDRLVDGVPAGRAGQRPAGGLRGCRRAAAADARRARSRARLRPAGGLAGPARRPPPRNGSIPALVLAVTAYVWAAGRRRGVQPRRGADHRRRTRGADGRVRRAASMPPPGSTEGAPACRRASGPPAEEIIRYEKDPKTKIATITFNRPEFLNAPTSDARLRYADVVRAASVDNDVKVVVIRGVGDNLGSGADLPEFMEGVDEPEKRLRELKVEARPRRRHLSAEGHVPQRRHDQRVVRQRAGGQPPAAGAQEDQHRRGQGLLLRLALLPVRRRRSGDLVRRRAVRPPVVPVLRLGSADVDLGADDGAAQVPGDGLHRSAVHRRGHGEVQLPQQGGAAGSSWRPRRQKYALACARNRPVDTVFMQKMFFEIYKQHQGEYMGSLLSARSSSRWAAGSPPTAPMTST